jgi:hypothetical protein
MYQVKVLDGKVWKGVLYDCLNKDTIVTALPEYGDTYVTIKTYMAAADLYDFVLREFHKDTQYDNLSAVKFVEMLSNGRERQVIQYKELKRRK